MTTSLIIILSFHFLRNETFVQFCKDILALIDKIGAGAVGIKAIADKLKISYATMAAARAPRAVHRGTVPRGTLPGFFIPSPCLVR
ncbi:MAG: hypothetical protein LBF09_02670 [Odoribacteraceae bacterium]|jgi:hypothetical protein|nr:hypothetical protein [Odoribacteraceae bacterium]